MSRENVEFVRNALDSRYFCAVKLDSSLPPETVLQADEHLAECAAAFPGYVAEQPRVAAFRGFPFEVQSVRRGPGFKVHVNRLGERVAGHPRSVVSTDS